MPQLSLYIFSSQFLLLFYLLGLLFFFFIYFPLIGFYEIVLLKQFHNFLDKRCSLLIRIIGFLFVCYVMLINYYILAQFLNTVMHIYFQTGTSLVPTNSSSVGSRSHSENKSFTYLAVGFVIGGSLGFFLGPRIRPYFSDSITVNGRILRGPKAMPENPYHRTFVDGVHTATGVGIAFAPTNIAYNMLEKDMSFLEAVDDVCSTTLLSDAADTVRAHINKNE
jgi:hypothetical protein